MCFTQKKFSHIIYQDDDEDEDDDVICCDLPPIDAKAMLRKDDPDFSPALKGKRKRGRGAAKSAPTPEPCGRRSRR